MIQNSNCLMTLAWKKDWVWCIAVYLYFGSYYFEKALTRFLRQFPHLRAKNPLLTGNFWNSNIGVKKGLSSTFCSLLLLWPVLFWEDFRDQEIWGWRPRIYKILEITITISQKDRALLFCYQNCSKAFSK
jgi:hypothetical protein